MACVIVCAQSTFAKSFKLIGCELSLFEKTWLSYIGLGLNPGAERFRKNGAMGSH